MKIVVDGYNAPVTAGAFVDLVDQKFYDGMEIQRADGMVVQTGRPEGNVRLSSSPVTLLYLLLALLLAAAAENGPTSQFAGVVTHNRLRCCMLVNPPIIETH